MLERDDLFLADGVLAVVAGRLVEDRFDPGKPRGVVHLDHRRQIAAVVERADRKLQAARVAIGQRRAAIFAEATVDIDRGLEVFRFPARPFETLARHRDQRAEEAAEGLLANMAM